MLRRVTNQADPGDGPPSAPASPGGETGRRGSPHDSVFRKVFSLPESAASQLRAVLPPEVAGRLDLGRLKSAPGSFVDEDLTWRHTDLLFTARTTDGQNALLYVLMEHQSTHDPLMAHRVLRYVTRIWDSYIEEHPGTRKLPAVIPLVVYQGRDRGRWASPVQLLDLIHLGDDAKKAMEAYLPRFAFALDDLTGVDEDRLRGRDLTPPGLVTLILLKTAPGNPRIAEDLYRWRPELRVVLDRYGQKTFQALMTYIERVGESSDSELRDLAASLGPDAEEAYVTTAEMLRAEGKTEGLAESVLRKLKKRGIPVDAHSHSRIMTCTDIDTLDAWLDRSLTVTKATDLFDN